MNPLAIGSEIGSLKRVILHTPGPEIEAMTPSEAEQDLYNDIIPLASVLGEYTQLKKFLSLVAETYELLDLLAECLDDKGDRFEFLTDLGRCFPIKPLMEDLMAMSSADLAKAVVRGIPAPHGSLAHTLDEHSFISRPLPNAYFMRDSAAVVGDCLVSAATAFDVRMVEAVITRFIFTHHEAFTARSLLVDGPAERNKYFTIEGGDVLVLSPTLFALGISERTTAFAVERFARNAARMAEKEITVFAVDLPRTRATIHLDMVFTMIDSEKALVYQPVILGPQRSSVYKIEAGKGGKLRHAEVNSLLEGLSEAGLSLEPVLCGQGHRRYQQREQWLSGANSFAFGPGKILVYSCNKLTAEALADSGFSIVKAEDFLEGRQNVEEYEKLAVTFEGIELARGGGGARCMTLPVERAPL